MGGNKGHKVMQEKEIGGQREDRGRVNGGRRERKEVARKWADI